MAMTSDLVSSTLVARAQEPDGLRKMMIVSAVGHVVAIAALVIAPWFVDLGPAQPEVVMEIGIAAAPGPPSGGMSSLSAKAVQKAEPKPELPKPEPVRPPAAKTPEMVETATKATPKPPVK